MSQTADAGVDLHEPVLLEERLVVSQQIQSVVTGVFLEIIKIDAIELSQAKNEVVESDLLWAEFFAVGCRVTGLLRCV